MIIRDKPGVWQLMFSVRGSVLPQIAWPLLFLVAFAMGLVLVDQALLKLPDSAATPFSVLGVALSLFLGFRNNAAYDRWWEARKLWGGLVADMRALARELDLFVPDAATRHRILQLSLAFVHLHRLSLRHQSPDATHHRPAGCRRGRADPCRGPPAVCGAGCDERKPGASPIRRPHRRLWRPRFVCPDGQHRRQSGGM